MIELVRQLGFLLLGGLFVWAGAMHFATFKSVAAMIGERGFPAPAFLLTAGSIVEIVGGLCLIFGIGRPYAAAALVVFTVAASLMDARLLAPFRRRAPEFTLSFYRQRRHHRRPASR